jgi:hypothetical protein
MYCIHLGTMGIIVYLGEQRVWVSEYGIGQCLRVESFATLKDAFDFCAYHKDYPMNRTSIWIRELFLAKKSLKNII